MHYPIRFKDTMPIPYTKEKPNFMKEDTKENIEMLFFNNNNIYIYIIQEMLNFKACEMRLYLQVNFEDTLGPENINELFMF